MVCGSANLGSDPSLVNKTVQLNGESYTVVGVMPPGFQFPTLRELWVPLILDPVKEPWRADRTNRNLAVFGRLKPGVTLDKAKADMSIVAQRLQEQYQKSNTGWNVRLRTFYDWIVPEEVRHWVRVRRVYSGNWWLKVCFWRVWVDCLAYC